MIPLVSKYWIVEVRQLRLVLEKCGLSEMQSREVCQSVLDSTPIRFSIQSPFICTVLSEPHTAQFTGEYVGVCRTVIGAAMLKHLGTERGTNKILFRLWCPKVATICLRPLVCLEHLEDFQRMHSGQWRGW